MKNRLLALLLIFIIGIKTAEAQIEVSDIFKRSLNDYKITLVDWQGNLYNPYKKIMLSPPADEVFPLDVTLKALGTSRLMFDYPSTMNSWGAEKQLKFKKATDVITVLLAIAPDRAGGFGEIEKYTFEMSYHSKKQVVPIEVVDEDDDLEPMLPLVFDYRFDTINSLFNREGYKEAAEMAIKDWFYFFDVSSFDSIPANSETAWITGNDWKNHVQVKNNLDYNGYWTFLRSIESPYSTGYPSVNGNYLKQNGVKMPGPLHRSSTLILHLYPDAIPFTSVDDEEWYLTDLYKVTDIYGLVMHEYGHAISYHDDWAGHNKYKVSGYKTAEDVIKYQGIQVPIDNSGHIPADKKYWDRMSGQTGGWKSLFPVRRWMISKLHLIIAAKAGWPLRKTSAFINPRILTDSLAAGQRDSIYAFQLEAEGGVPDYCWQLIEGHLPKGLVLNSFTGTISGTISSNATKNNFFTVLLRDQDELQAVSEKTYNLLVNNGLDNNEEIQGAFTDAGSVIDYLEGSWSWKRSNGGFWGTMKEPGIDKLILFKKMEGSFDSIGYYLYCDSILSECGKAKIHKVENVEFGLDPQWIISLLSFNEPNQPLSHQLIVAGKDEMRLNENVEHGWEHHLSRNSTSVFPGENECGEFVTGSTDYRFRQQMFKIYPNPSNGEFAITIQGELLDVNPILKIIDMTGKEVFKCVIAARETQTINLANYLTEGVFCAVLALDNKFYQDRIMISKVNHH
jgi:hypothetical protein